MELLFEYGKSCLELHLSYEDSLETIQSELRRVDEGIVLCGSESSHFLQKWSKRWNCFVNVNTISDLTDGDRLAVRKQDAKEKDVEVSGGQQFPSSYPQQSVPTHHHPGGKFLLASTISGRRV